MSGTNITIRGVAAHIDWWQLELQNYQESETVRSYKMTRLIKRHLKRLWRLVNWRMHTAVDNIN